MSNTTFKRIVVGDKFTKDGKSFRKNGKATAIALLPNGRGQTHASVKFSRSAAVEATSGRITAS